jgi:aspartyl-tRNA(Asn)/glutamyl-tRNA(Gln) amidotransferase subunit A
VRTLIRRDFEQAFQQCDALLTPTTPTTAFKLGEKVSDPLTMYLSDIFTVSMNLAGVPALSLPAGKDKQGLPIGLQIIAKAFDETTMFQLAHYLERAGI